MSMYDFYMYLKHIEHSPENLEFFVWFKNYEAGRLTGTPSRPQTKASSDPAFDFAPSSVDSMMGTNEKPLGPSESQVAINTEYGMSPLLPPSPRGSTKISSRHVCAYFLPRRYKL